MEINYNVSSNVFKTKDYNVDTIYIRYNEKYYKVLDHETREKKEVSKEEFNKLDVSEREVNYTEEQYTYKEYVEKLEKDIIEEKASSLDEQVKSEVGFSSAITSMELMNSISKLELKVAELEKQLGGDS